MVVSPNILKKMAAAAAQETLPRFRQFNEIDNKYTTGFDPVTEADRAAERAIRAVIKAEFPDHGIIGEEYGAENEASSHVWIIDPIDGTRAFISGLPVWGTLAGLKIDGIAKAGFMSQPFTGELFYSDGTGSYLEHGSQNRRQLATRQTKQLSDATIFTTTPELFKGKKKENFEDLRAQVRLTRYGVDCYAFAMLAAGFADIVIETGLQTYDIAALIPIIEQAGGIVTTFAGGRAENGGDIIAAATPELHDAAMKIFNQE